MSTYRKLLGLVTALLVATIPPITAGHHVQTGSQQPSTSLALLEPYEQIDTQLFDKVLSSGPQEIQMLFSLLKNLNRMRQLNIKSNKILLVGPHGCGKTTLAQGIPQQLNWDYMIIKGSNIANSYKNSGNERLREIFEEAQHTQKPFVLIIDELHCITDGFNNPANHDRNLTEAFWQNLDAACKNDQFFFIGTTNFLDRMPQGIQDRFFQNIYYFSCPNHEQRLKIVHHYLTTSTDTTALLSYDNDLIHYITKKTNGYSSREIESAIEAIKRQALFRYMNNESQNGNEGETLHITLTKQDVNNLNLPSKTKRFVALRFACNYLKAPASFAANVIFCQATQTTFQYILMRLDEERQAQIRDKHRQDPTDGTWTSLFRSVASGAAVCAGYNLPTIVGFMKTTALPLIGTGLKIAGAACLAAPAIPCVVGGCAVIGGGAVYYNYQPFHKRRS